VLTLATGSATRLVATDRAVLRRMRHGDEEALLPTSAVPGTGQPRKNGQARAH